MSCALRNLPFAEASIPGASLDLAPLTLVGPDLAAAAGPLAAVETASCSDLDSRTRPSRPIPDRRMLSRKIVCPDSELKHPHARNEPPRRTSHHGNRTSRACVPRSTVPCSTYAYAQLPSTSSLRSSSSITANKLRSFLTMFGIAWGVASLLLLIGLGEGFRSGQRRSSLSNLGNDIILISMQAPSPRCRGPARPARRPYKITLGGRATPCAPVHRMSVTLPAF